MTKFRWSNIAAAAGLAVLAFAGQQADYRVKPISPPPLKRPEIKAVRENLPQGATGRLSTFDGEAFQVNLPSRGDQQPNEAQARETVGQVLRAVGWSRDPAELRAEERGFSQGASANVLERETRQGVDEKKKRETGRVGKLSTPTQKAIEDRAAEARSMASRSQTIIRFNQIVQGARIEDTGVNAVYQAGRGLASISGRAFNTVNLTNQSRISQADAVAAAQAHVRRSTQLAQTQAGRPPERVILPYGDGFKFAWRIEVTAQEGSYRLWIDAENRSVLRLEPLFFPDSANGLTFNPDPNTGTLDKSFEVNSPSGGNYSLILTSRVNENNAGADGTSGDLSMASGGATSANFNVAPFNGTVVERTNQAGYNGRFQEVNAYAWVHSNIQLFEGLGSTKFPLLTVTVNHNNPCGFGINNACGGNNAVTFGIGQATTSASTAGGALFNSAIDATVVTHEFGHVLTQNQNNAIPFGPMHEGLSDFWAATVHNNSIFGGWWKHNGGSVPVQSSFVPRQAEPLDVFPEHRALGSGLHADGQMLNWALWSTRTGLNNAGALGALVINTSLIKALPLLTAPPPGGATDQVLHTGYLDMLQQLTAQITSSSVHKLLSGFARAGILLAPRDAIIDINDDFLNRNDATGPTFTVFGGRDFQFNAAGTAVAGAFFNTRFQVEAANDASFTQNLVSSGFLNTIAVDANGVPLATWTMPAAQWNTVKGGDKLFYRVTTTDANGGNQRTSLQPGNGFLNAPVPSAVINDSGQILTSLHVVEGVIDIQITYADGTEANGEVIASKAENDIAVLSSDQLPEVLIPAVLGNPHAMQVGDEAFAVGNPFGLYGSVSAGVISGFGRTFQPEDSDQELEDLIQIDAAVNPGNSGGPLLNRYGQVIGIVVGIINPTEDEFFIGIGFAVPIDTAGGVAGIPPY